MKKKSNKILATLLLIIMLLNVATNTIYAGLVIEKEKILLKKFGSASQHLKYYREKDKEYRYLICSIVGYEDKNGKFNPTYCMNRDLTGAEDTPYNVSVDSLLNNNKVWRVIKNGYPYKSAKELGLKSSYDAYAVTKWAVYCILGEAKLDYYKAEKDDDEAVAMLKALKKLVKIGNEGTEKQDDNPLKIQEIGSLKEEGEYYYQEFKVTSTADFGEYKIKKTKNLPQNAYIANSKGEKSTKLKASENFRVMIPKTVINKDINLNIEIEASCESYVILYGKTTVNNTQNYVVTAGKNATATQSINFKKNTNTGRIRVNKTDAETGKPIEGVEFELRDSNNKTISKQKTDKDGIIDFNELYQGDYKLIETKQHKDYIITESEFEVNVQIDKTTTKNIQNNHKRGNLRIYKVDEDNNEVRLGNVEFELYSEELHKTVGTHFTNVDGEIYIENLRTGDYILKEKNTNKWYNLIDDLNIKVEWEEDSKDTEVTIKNSLKKGQVKIVKVDKDNNEIKLEGVKFNVLDEKGNVLETIVTNSKGEAYTSKYIIRDYKKIYLQEIETNKNYELNNEKIEVQLKANEISEIKIENEKIKGKIKIIKTSKDRNDITNEKPGTPLKGVVFEIYDINKKVVDKIVTNENGICVSKQLEKGIYYIKEISTNEWYFLNNKTFNAEIKNNNQIVELRITNESKKPDIDIEKTGPDTAEIGSEIEYDISVRNTGNTSLDKFKWHDTIPTDYIKITRFETGTYNQDLRYNLYYKTNLSDDKYILMMEGLNSFENYKIDFEKELADNEYVTDIKLEFGTVDVGFNSNENPHLFAKIKDTVKSGDTFINRVDISGEINRYKVKDKSKWKTKTFKILPRTGF